MRLRIDFDDDRSTMGPLILSGSLRLGCAWATFLDAHCGIAAAELVEFVCPHGRESDS